MLQKERYLANRLLRGCAPLPRSSNAVRESTNASGPTPRLGLSRFNNKELNGHRHDDPL